MEFLFNMEENTETIIVDVIEQLLDNFKSDQTALNSSQQKPKPLHTVDQNVEQAVVVSRPSSAARKVGRKKTKTACKRRLDEIFPADSGDEDKENNVATGKRQSSGKCAKLVSNQLVIIWKI